MTIDISGLDRLMPKAVGHFWKAREAAADGQRKRGGADQGNRSGVTAGKNLDGFIKMAHRLVVDNGFTEAEIQIDGRVNLTIPGYYRPTKSWDLLVISKEVLVAAIEFKSQVGPSFGNNFNNRVEEAIGNAVDLNTAYREGVFGESPKPFIGYFFVLEECPESTTSVRFNSPHFSAMKEFENTSYAERYEILCRRLVQEGLYDSAALVLTKRSSRTRGQYRSISELTSAKRFAMTLAGKVSGMAVD